MVILDETEDTPRRVWVKMYTVQAHARTPPGHKNDGTANFSWKKHEKKHRKKNRRAERRKRPPKRRNQFLGNDGRVFAVHEAQGGGGIGDVKTFF